MVYMNVISRNTNQFGKTKYAGTYTTTGTELNAGLTWDVPFTTAEKENYSPFTNLVVNNASAERLEIRINTAAVDTAGFATRIYFLEGLATMTITSEEEILIHTLTIKNTSANNLTAGDVRVTFANHGLG